MSIMAQVQRAVDSRNFDNDVLRLLQQADKYSIDGPIRIGTNTINGSIVEMLLETIEVMDQELNKVHSYCEDLSKRIAALEALAPKEDKAATKTKTKAE